MYQKYDIFRILVTVMVLVSLTVGIASAAPVTQSIYKVTSHISYQGKLTDAAGNPLTGSYSMTFRLYEPATGGTALSTDTHSVTVDKGLFTTYLEFYPQLFDGRSLYLGISVGSDPEMTPRQQIKPVPYALGLAPGAEIRGSGDNYALKLYNEQPYSKGLLTETTGDQSPGIQIFTSGDNSRGLSSFTGGFNSPAVYGYGNVGVYGNGKEGGFFMTDEGGTSWDDLRHGVNISTVYTFNPGLNIRTTGYSSNGMRALTSGDWSDGVDIITSGIGSRAIYAETQAGNSNGLSVLTAGQDSDGIEARTTGMASDAVAATTEGQFSGAVSAMTSGENSVAVWAQTDGSSSDAVVVYAMGPSSKALYAYSHQSPAIWAETGRSDNKYGVQTPDIIRALSYETGASDVAEYMSVTGEVSPGTILVIGPDGKLQPSTSAYDTGVAGIVSTAPGVSLGAKEGGNPGEQLIAVAGRVPCKVDTSNGPIHPRDLLTTSNNPGYAMKATNPQIGTILGKAMGTLESGTGTIEVLVTLQ